MHAIRWQQVSINGNFLVELSLQFLTKTFSSSERAEKLQNLDEDMINEIVGEEEEDPNEKAAAKKKKQTKAQVERRLAAERKRAAKQGGKKEVDNDDDDDDFETFAKGSRDKKKR